MKKRITKTGISIQDNNKRIIIDLAFVDEGIKYFSITTVSLIPTEEIQYASYVRDYEELFHINRSKTRGTMTTTLIITEDSYNKMTAIYEHFNNNLETFTKNYEDGRNANNKS
tara:strand:+ start:553 stop:891 length:339 start_codon:yes stop_codon:yes gene_type:complete